MKRAILVCVLAFLAILAGVYVQTTDVSHMTWHEIKMGIYADFFGGETTPIKEHK